MNLQLVRLLPLLPLILVLAGSAGAQAPLGTVHLHNGGRIHGELMEVLPGEQVRLRLADGTVRSIPWSDVARVDDPNIAPTPASEPQRGQASPAPRPAAAPRSAPERAEPYFKELAGAAQDPEEQSTQVTLALFGSLGLAGSLSGNVEATRTANGMSETEAEAAEADLDPSFGGGAHIDVPLHTHFSLGGFVRALSWKTSQTDDRSLFLDFALTPRARFPFPVGARWGAFFIEAALGVGIFDLPGDDAEDSPSGVAIETSNSPLFLAGGGAGLQLLLTDAVGVFFELAWHHHFFGRSVSATGTTASGVRQIVKGDVDYDGGQLMLQVGLLAGL